MTNDLQITPIILTNQSFAVRQERRQLLKIFWLAVTVLFLVELYTVKTDSILTIISATLIAFAALLPFYLWCSGKALGIPIFPLFALTYLWTTALPLLSKNYKVINYLPSQYLLASITIVCFLGLGTFIWFQFVKSSPPVPKYYRTFKGSSSVKIFEFFFVVGIICNMGLLGGWFAFSGGILTLVRGIVLGLNILSIFVLSYRCGTREASKTQANLFLVLLVLYIITNAVSLLLVGALSAGLLATIAFLVARRKVPFLPIILVLIFFSLLHYGKGDMREKYWHTDRTHFVQPWEYPAWYSEWMGYSFDYLTSNPQKQKQQSVVERAGVIHLLLMTQARTPQEVPYLSGETYTIIPQLLVPRILNRNKISSHEGTYLLNIHYGLQNRAATLTTTIGWGALNEAYANFGFLGCAGLAIVLGSAYGQATRWSMNTSLLSSRSLFGILLLNFAFQSEWTAGVYIAALFQSLVPLVIITFLLMKVHSHEEVMWR